MTTAPTLYPPKDWDRPTREEIAYAVANNLSLYKPGEREAEERRLARAYRRTR